MLSARHSLLVTVVLSALAVSACTEEGGRRDAGPLPTGDAATDATPGAVCSGGTDHVTCVGTAAVMCSAANVETGRTDCAPLGQACVVPSGCVACQQNAQRCGAGNTVERCRADGSGYDVAETCDAAAGEACVGAGQCRSACSDAESSNSYIGCEYWPTPTLNAQLDATFKFGVVVTNPGTAPANVTITRGPTSIATRTIAAGAVETFELDYVPALKQELIAIDSAPGTALARGAAYRLRSNQPVTVYQFNPLDYRVDRSCFGEFTFPPECFSFTNDASLLLPTHVLTGNYLVSSWSSTHVRVQSSGQIVTYSGFLAIVGVEDAPTEVTITFSANTNASVDGTVTAFAPGQVGTFTLSQGDVLQIGSGRPTTCTPNGSGVFGLGPYDHCTSQEAYDLTGTQIRSPGRVAVYGGHDCAFVPSNRTACDHLEEALFPEDTWGKEAIVSITQPLSGEPNLVRVLSSRDGNAITFEPSSAHAGVTLNRGQYVEFIATSHFRVTGTEPISVSQFLVGQNYNGESLDGQGDPSLSLAIPTEQFRTEYSFLAPATYDQSFVNVTAPTSATVTLDGAPVSGFTPVGSTGYGVARVPVAGGAHRITSDQGFGIIVYGFGRYTSYMYPGGLDLEKISIPL